MGEKTQNLTKYYKYPFPTSKMKEKNSMSKGDWGF